MHEIVLVADIGTILNPVAHQGQLNGGVVFGLGSGATEELIVENGKIVNLNLGDDKLPTHADDAAAADHLFEADRRPGAVRVENGGRG